MLTDICATICGDSLQLSMKGPSLGAMLLGCDGNCMLEAPDHGHFFLRIRK